MLRKVRKTSELPANRIGSDGVCCVHGEYSIARFSMVSGESTELIEKGEAPYDGLAARHLKAQTQEP